MFDTEVCREIVLCAYMPVNMSTWAQQDSNDLLVLTDVAEHMMHYLI